MLFGMFDQNQTEIGTASAGHHIDRRRDCQIQDIAAGERTQMATIGRCAGQDGSSFKEFLFSLPEKVLVRFGCDGIL